jgi:hypothetical protein
MQVNKHLTSDCIVFVLVYERAAYYDHRHRGIYETNILQAVKQQRVRQMMLICFHVSFLRIDFCCCCFCCL